MMGKETETEEKSERKKCRVRKEYLGPSSCIQGEGGSIRLGVQMMCPTRSGARTGQAAARECVSVPSCTCNWSSRNNL